ncbi:MAG: RNA polymerase sigma factor [Thermodesulforhabdaceae bacterium]
MVFRATTDLAKIKEAILDKTKGGSREAYEEIFVNYRDRIFSAAYHLCNFDREAALDLTQDVFLKVWEKFSQFDGRSDIYTWIYRIMLNLYFKEQRKKRLYERFLQLFGVTKDERDHLQEASQLSNLEQEELKRALVKAMKKLSPKQEIVFKLKILDGMTFSRISEVTDMAEGTVKTHFIRAIKTLQQELKEWSV